ncbi:MAG: ATP-binding cassette domain-containing protein [Elusimicrobia bacterium]|nr:ATP-binding cassette domain-containing protein [Elusimicrobiota bacterium]
MILLEFRGVGFDDGKHATVQRLDFSVGPGERLFVFGRSGSGKGTVLRLAAGVLEPDAGSVRLSHPPGCRLPVGYVPKEGGLLSNLSLLENAVLPIVYHGLEDAPSARARARALFAELGLSDHASRRPADVGVSARRLAHMARAVLAEPAVFVLEDPLSEVDAAAARAIKKLIEHLGREGRSLILGAGTLGPFREWEGRFLFLRDGKGTIFDDAGALRSAKDSDVKACLE